MDGIFQIAIAIIYIEIKINPKHRYAGGHHFYLNMN